MKFLTQWILTLLFGVCTLTAISFDKDGNAIESSSSVLFPAHYLPSKQDLVGMTVRTKKIVFVDFQVYAVGLYIDSSVAKIELSKLKGKESSAYTSDSYNAIIHSDLVPKTLRLVMVRTVSGDQMGSAIGEAVESRLKKIQLSASSDEIVAIDGAFKLFREQFNMPQLLSGAELSFSIFPGGKLLVNVGGRSQSITSRELCVSFLDVFLGDSSVVNRNLLVTRLSSILG